MNKNKTTHKELFILPSFFASFLPNDSGLLINETYDNYNIDQYSQIRQYTNGNISSKFKEIRYIPFSESILDYEDDLWDFSEYTLIKGNYSIFHFLPLPDYYKNELKDFILILILKDTCKISTLSLYLYIIRKFLVFISERGIKSVSDICIYDITEYLESRQITQLSLMKEKNVIGQFLQLYDLEHSTNIYSFEISEILKRLETKLFNAIIKKNRRKPINDEYFDNLIKALIRQMDDVNNSIQTRVLSAMLIIDSQTGLRASELSLLEVDSVESINIEGINYRMMQYKIIKTAKGNMGYTENTTFINDLSYKAYELVKELHKENRQIRNSNLLYCPKKAILPSTPSVFLEYLRDFCILNSDEIGACDTCHKGKMSSINALAFSKHKYEGRPISKTPLNIIKNIKDETIFYYPIVHQFRNTVVNRLIRSGVNLEFVRRYMGHLSAEMTATYADYNDTDIQENILFSENTLKTYLTGEARILGNSGSQLMERIDEWILKEKFNIAEDLDEIICKLLKVIPIRSKHGGMCIKGSKIADACSVDSKTDEFFCACGVCPNVCHFYFMINITYCDFKETVKIYKYNLDKGFTRQAEKELSKIKYLIANRLNPEILELEREISIKGIEKILEMHPELSEIIINLSIIKSEVEIWN